ncbi:ribosomal protein S18-alanine N-acetyltransferase [Thermohalobacter berrensis]|uniref:[Ribosomal protein bS18]-alanine N-acetyltransferase n=1 Tax=Thermohalobacter berrensis TaxID=99594 RepID=A0A419T477_9FIRM|nr:ribosomal protein S18-alanine N-acetyltransferase [Thermohalobacter berrensis]RKD32367.1 ribosomal-protein-alanine N-acetyltransferase [Thermohalobacter berrensis]
MPNLILREMETKDLEEVLYIENTCFTTPWSKNAFIKEITENKLAKYIVAQLEDKVVGYGGMWIILDEGHITNIAVAPNYRGLGIGSAIVKELINICKKLEINRMTLEVRKSNIVAQNLYEKYGFKACGVRPKYYSDTNEDAIIMWKEV